MPSERSIASEITGLKAERQNARSISLQTWTRPLWITASVTGSSACIAFRPRLRQIGAAVDRQDHAVGVARRIAREIADRADHLVHARKPAQRVAPRQLDALALGELLGHRALDHRWRHGIAGDPVARTLQGIA